MHAIVTRKLFFSPSSDPLLSNRGGRARKTKSSFFVLSPRTILLSDEKSEETGIPLAHFGNSPRSSTSYSRFKTRTRRFFFFLIQKSSSFDQIPGARWSINVTAKYTAVHRLHPLVESPQPRVVNKTIEPRADRNSIVPRHGRSNRATIFVLARNPCPGERGA